MRLIALDPGETTGVANAEWDGVSAEATLQMCADLRGLTALGHWLEACAWDDPVIIYETFRLYPHKARDLIASDMIAAQAVGIIKYTCRTKRLVPQSASMAKGLKWGDVERYLKNADMASTPHQRDACRHIVYYILSEHNRRRQTVASDAAMQHDFDGLMEPDIDTPFDAFP